LTVDHKDIIIERILENLNKLAICVYLSQKSFVTIFSVMIVIRIN